MVQSRFHNVKFWPVESDINMSAIYIYFGGGGSGVTVKQRDAWYTIGQKSLAFSAQICIKFLMP